MRCTAMVCQAVCLCFAAAWCDQVPYEIGRFPQEVAVTYTKDQGLPSNDVREVAVDGDGVVWVITAEGAARFEQGAFVAAELPETAPRMVPQSIAIEGAKIRQFAPATPSRQLAVAAADEGLYSRTMTPGATFEPMTVRDKLGRIWAAEDVRGVAFDAKEHLWVATPAGVAAETEDGWTFYTGPDGLPYADFTCVSSGPEETMWFGTKLGAVFYDGKEWAYRQGRGWLPDDDVRCIAVEANGTAWFATGNGLGCIERRMMTLAEKAEYYEDEMEKFIRRTPYGYVAEVRLGKPGERSGVLQHDSDNDGLWTAMYGAGECFAYGATQSPQAKDRAKRAFEALRFLQKVTQDTPNSPPKGYVARSILPTDGPDPNKGRVEEDLEERKTRDKLWKVYEPRWPVSADGKWYFKTDTSSDELDGHYYFYPLYYDLVADTEEEKDRVREVVRDLTDHLVNNGFYLVDHDGKPTRWGVFAPEALNDSPDWWAERGLNSLSILSYLCAAAHVTEDERYIEIMKDLAEKHGYRSNAMWYKLHMGPGSGNQSDDEMAFMNYYNIVKYCPDETLRQQILYSFYLAWMVEQPEMNPFFNFCYAAYGIKETYANPFGEMSVGPWQGWLEDSMATLRGFSLDRCNWGTKNSQRLDLVLLPRQQSSVPGMAGYEKRGYRVNGKVLPVENRTFGHWNTDPWDLDYGGKGNVLTSGTVFLLPYYMGLYHGFIKEVD